jgi:APA family basic amino acid/polyamine antiporter
MASSLLATKPLELVMHEAQETGEHTLRRTLGPVSLISLGIGAIVGAGIFVLTGAAAAQYAGPAIVLSFILAGVGCVFAGLCYAEFAAMIPLAGSAYTYAYATLGELFAWIIGWDLILEYAFGAATVASGWSGYFNSFLQDFGIHIPPQLTSTPGTEMVMYNGRWERLATILPTSIFFLALVIIPLLYKSITPSANSSVWTPRSFLSPSRERTKSGMVPIPI